MRKTLIQIYESRVASGDLRADPAQHAVLPALDSLRDWLEQNASRKIGLFAGLFAKPITPPKGLYLWGGVGRGKSMLMDLFTDAVAIPNKRRVHFHAFMQEVHHGLHAARKRGAEDALAPVADAMTRDPIVLRSDDALVDAARVLDEAHISGAPVVDAQGILVGVLSVLGLDQAAAGFTGTSMPFGTRLAATVVLVVWIAIIYLGRSIAYDAEIWGSWSLGVYA